MIIIFSCRCLHARFDPFRESPIIKAIMGSFEHRLWPIHDENELDTYGEVDFTALAEH